MKTYKIISLWPDNTKGFKVDDILTQYPSGDENEKRYGCNVEKGNYQYIESPELYGANLVEI